jgi:hypothetical protein
MNLLDILGYAGDVLDTPGRLTRTALAGRNPFPALFDPQQGVSGRQLLEHYGLVGPNEDQGWIPDAGDLGGFAAETILDPTNLIGGGMLAKLLAKAKKARTSNAALDLLSPSQNARNRAENWIISSAAQANGLNPDDRIKRVSEWIRSGETLTGPIPKETIDELMHSLKPTFDRETGEVLDISNSSWPRTGTILDFLDEQDDWRASRNQASMSVPRTTPLLAALLGHNVVARSHSRKKQ